MGCSGKGGLGTRATNKRMGANFIKKAPSKSRRSAIAAAFGGRVAGGRAPKTMNPR